MTIFARLEQWREQGAISAEQQVQLAGLCRRKPFSLFLELNILLYAGVLAFVTGLAWTIATCSHQLGDVAIVAILSGLLAGCFWYCFSRATPWSRTETPSPTAIFDYVLYLGCLVWCVELAYLEKRFHLLSGQWDAYLLASAWFFLFLAYRFDNRFVLSLGLSSLAAWFGLTISHWPTRSDIAYRLYAVVYSALVGLGGAAAKRRGLKPHFFGTYLNVASNVMFWALLSGVFDQREYGIWFLALLLACGSSLVWGVTRRQFAFVAYAAVYGYIGFSDVLVRYITDGTIMMGYFVLGAAGMLVGLIRIARRFGRRP